MQKRLHQVGVWKYAQQNPIRNDGDDDDNDDDDNDDDVYDDDNNDGDDNWEYRMEMTNGEKTHRR